MTLAIIIVPALAGIACFIVNNDKTRRTLLVLSALTHGTLVAKSFFNPSPAGEYIGLDSLGLLFLSITSFLFAAASFYTVGYLEREDKSRRADFQEKILFANQPEKLFTGCLLLFLSSMSLVTASQNIGLLWIGVEATTLSSAPLIYFHRHHRSLEAVWKYLLVCSVGIATALFGVFALASAAVSLKGAEASLKLADILIQAPNLNPAWLKMAFIFMFVGYGTKMGLAPFHTWLPDAYGEAPSVVSGLLSGSLSSCAFLAMLRGYQTLQAAGLGEFAQGILIAFGLISMLVAAVFIVRQKDFKRMLAYSSVEHMGIMTLAVGIGGGGAFGAALHTMSHSLTKAALFMLAGNIITCYKTKAVSSVNGAIKSLPLSGALWVAGFLAITGAPPFGIFMSEFTILKAALDGGHIYIAAAYLFLLAVIFVGMLSAVIPMSYGSPSTPDTKLSEPALSALPPMALLAAALVIGIYIPPGIMDALNRMAQALGGGL